MYFLLPYSNAVLLEHLGHLSDGILSLGHSHTITRNDNDLSGGGDHINCLINIHLVVALAYINRLSPIL